MADNDAERAERARASDICSSFSVIDGLLRLPPNRSPTSAAVSANGTKNVIDEGVLRLIPWRLTLNHPKNMPPRNDPYSTPRAKFCDLLLCLLIVALIVLMILTSPRRHHARVDDRFCSPCRVGGEVGETL